MTNIGDHPLVANALDTGYPEEERFVCCADCGGEFYGSDKMYEFEGNWICSDCTKDRILDAFGTAELASAFGFIRSTVQEILEVS
jgi:hypothetical protein